MATAYPDHVTDKDELGSASNGNTIEASHINDLRRRIERLEGAYDDSTTNYIVQRLKPADYHVGDAVAGGNSAVDSTQRDVCPEFIESISNEVNNASPNDYHSGNYVHSQGWNVSPQGTRLDTTTHSIATRHEFMFTTDTDVDHGCWAEWHVEFRPPTDIDSKSRWRPFSTVIEVDPLSDQVQTGLNSGTVTSATTVNPAVFTDVAHGLLDGQSITFSSVTGGTWNGTIGSGTFVVANKTDDTFELTGVDGTGLGTLTSASWDRVVRDGSRTPGVTSTGVVGDDISFTTRIENEQIMKLVRRGFSMTDFDGTLRSAIQHTSSGIVKFSDDNLNTFIRGNRVDLPAVRIFCPDGMFFDFGTGGTGVKIGNNPADKMGFWNATPVIQQTVTGSTGGNAALQNLLSTLATIGLIVDSTT